VTKNCLSRPDGLFQAKTRHNKAKQKKETAFETKTVLRPLSLKKLHRPKRVFFVTMFFVTFFPEKKVKE